MERENAAHAAFASTLSSATTPLINPDPIKKQLDKINSLVDRKRENLIRKGKDMASENKTPASSKFLIAVFAFLGGEIFKILWKKFNHKETVPNVASKSTSIGRILLYSLLSSLSSTLFSLLGYRVFDKNRKKGE